MGSIDIIKPLSTVIISAINKSHQHQEKNYWEGWESNPGLLGKKQVCYLCALFHGLFSQTFPLNKFWFSSTFSWSQSFKRMIMPKRIQTLQMTFSSGLVKANRRVSCSTSRVITQLWQAWRHGPAAARRSQNSPTLKIVMLSFLPIQLFRGIEAKFILNSRFSVVFSHLLPKPLVLLCSPHRWCG